MPVLYMTYAYSGTASTPNEPVVGIHTTPPAACLHIANRAAAMTPFRIDNAVGTQILSLDNSGNLTIPGTLTASFSPSFSNPPTMPTSYSSNPTSTQ